MNDNFDENLGTDNSANDIIPLHDNPLRIAVIGGEVLIDTVANPSLTADAAEKTGVALIAASHELRGRSLARLHSLFSLPPQF